MATWHRVLLALTAISLRGSLLRGSAESVLGVKVCNSSRGFIHPGMPEARSLDYASTQHISAYFRVSPLFTDLCVTQGQKHADIGDEIVGDATQRTEWAIQHVRMRRRLLAEVQHAPDQLQPAKTREASDQTGNASGHGAAYSGSQQDGSSLPDRHGRATHARDGDGDGTGHWKAEDGTHEADFGDVNAEKHHAASGDPATASGQETQPADAVHKAHLAAKHSAEHRSVSWQGCHPPLDACPPLIF